jgi:hypothetical protein
MFFTLQRHNSNEAFIIEIEDLRDLLNIMEFDSYVDGFTSGDKLVYRDESERKYFER